jgi:hypothetical protein
MLLLTFWSYVTCSKVNITFAFTASVKEFLRIHVATHNFIHAQDLGVHCRQWRTDGGEGGLNPRNSEVLTKLGRIPSSVENTYIRDNLIRIRV